MPVRPNEFPEVSPAAADEAKAAPKVAEAEVNAAQQAWCDGLVTIGKAHADGGDSKATATQIIDAAYDYDGGKVLFNWPPGRCWPSAGSAGGCSAVAGRLTTPTALT